MDTEVPLYGLDDASRKFWFKIKGILKNKGMKAVNEDKDFYYNHEEGILAGIVITHVDDFLIVGDKKIDKIGRKDKSKLVSMKVEKDEYWFTGIDVR